MANALETLKAAATTGNVGSRIRGYADPFIQFYNAANSVASRIRAGGTYESLSDRRTKHDIEDANDIGLENILKMQPRRFVRNGMERVELGWISQEMQEALPEAVIAVDPNDPDEHLYINDQPVIVALVAAVKQLSAKVTALGG